MRYRNIVFILTAVLLCLSACAKAPETAPPEKPGGEVTHAVLCDYPYYESADALWEKAGLVIRGTVLASRNGYRNHAIELTGEDKDDPRLNPGGEYAPMEERTTIYTVEVHEVYKGNAGETTELQQIGGADVEGFYVEDWVEIETGVEYVMFLGAGVLYENAAWLMGGGQGLYKVEGDDLTGFPALTYAELERLYGSHDDTRRQ